MSFCSALWKVKTFSQRKNLNSHHFQSLVKLVYVVTVFRQSNNQIKHYGKTSDDYNNTESDIDEDEDEPEEDWKFEAEESDSDIDVGDMSDGDVERRIRARRI